MRVTRLAALNCHDRKISSGNIGCRTLLSAATKPASEPRPMAPDDNTPAVAPRSPASMRAHLTPPTPTPLSPGQPDDGQQPTGDVDAPPPRGIARRGNVPERHDNHSDSQRHVDQKD